MNHPDLDIHPDVAQALAAGRPVVALESTIISHGMPYPQNVETARRVEAEVRRHGAVPATIAILGGRLQAGLTAEQIDHLGRDGRAVAKVSRRDLPFIVAAGQTGATTVAATMIIAAMAGIRVFATGGIGGVHRARRRASMSRPICRSWRARRWRWCARAPSPFSTCGSRWNTWRHTAFPWWATAPTPCRRSTRARVSSRSTTGSTRPPASPALCAPSGPSAFPAGMVVANPIPAAFAMPRERVDAAIAQALREAQAQGITGKETTPFLLARVTELTGGDSLAANIELVLNNARLAAAIAVAYCTP